LPSLDASGKAKEAKKKEKMLQKGETVPVPENMDHIKEEPEDESVKMLYVLVHGANSEPSDWGSIRRELYNRFNNSILIMTSSSNSHSTQEGIEVGGRNLACEIAGFINQAFQVGPRTLAKQRYLLFVKSDRFGVSNDNQPFDSPYAPPNPNKKHSEDTEAERDLYLINSARIASGFIENGSKTIPITLIGHSIGGLYVRNAVGWLYFYGFFPTMEVDSANDSNDTRTLKNPFPALLPRGIFTFCTPHLGYRRSGGWVKSWKSMVRGVLSHSNGQTGIELALEDHLTKEKNSLRNRSDIPLLWGMTLSDSIYMRGLRVFCHRTMVGITHHDKVVPYCSAVATGHNPYPFPPNRNTFAVVGSFGFTKQHNLVIIPYQDLTLSGIPRVNGDHIVPTTSDEMDTQEVNIFASSDLSVPVNMQPSASIIGIPKNPATSGYYTDTNLEIEYPSEMLTNLQSVTWRRLDIQFPNISPSVHEMPLQKIPKSKTVSNSSPPGHAFVIMLSDLLAIDLAGYTP